VLQSQTLEVVFETLGRSVAFSPNENWMVVGGYTGEVSIFSTLDWNKISTIESRYSKSNFFRSVGASDRLSMVTGEIVRFTPDEKRILSGGPDGRISILAVPTLEELFTIVPSDSRLFDLAGVAAMQLDELGKMLLVGFKDAKLRLINLDSPTPLSLQHPKWHNSSPWELLGLLRWHRQQAERAEGIRNWHSASFHRKWQVRAFPRDAVAAYRLREVYSKWKAEFQSRRNESDTDAVHSVGRFLSPIIRESLKLPIGTEVSSNDAEALNGMYRDAVKSSLKEPLINFELLELSATRHPGGPILNTLGVAYYRLGRFEDAIVTLTKSLPLNLTGEDKFEDAIAALTKSLPLNITGKDKSVPSPADTAFLALSNLKLGNKDEAAKYRAMFVDAMKIEANSKDEDNQSF